MFQVELCVECSPFTRGILVADSDRAQTDTPSTPPESMSPDDLKKFVHRALQAAKSEPVREDLRKWQIGRAHV